MTEHLYSALDELVPRFDHEQGDWSRVVADARARRPTPRASRSPDISTERSRSRRWLTGRRLAVIAIAVVAIATPLIAVSGHDWWSFVGPLLMSFLLLRVSGVALLERDIGGRRPAFLMRCALSTMARSSLPGSLSMSRKCLGPCDRVRFDIARQLAFAAGTVVARNRAAARPIP